MVSIEKGVVESRSCVSLMLPMKHLANAINTHRPDSAFDSEIDPEIDPDVNPDCPEPYSPPPFP